MSRSVSRTSEAGGGGGSAVAPPALPDKADQKAGKTSFFEDAARVGRREARKDDGSPPAGRVVVEARPEGALIRLEFEFRSKLFAGEAEGLVTVLQEECERKLG